MPVNRELKELAFAKLLRFASKISAKPTPESIHRFRTNSRRVESLLELVPELNSNQKKALKLLKRLRGKAGRVRDLDIQIAALRSLKISQSPADKSQLLRGLAEERDRRLSKLEKAFDKKTAAELKRRLQRANKETEISEKLDPLAAGLCLFHGLEKDGGPLSEEKLHQYRIVGKRARYLAELAGETPEAEATVEQLKRLQDIIGDWHDWLELSNRAEKVLGDHQASALVAALRNLTRAKFRQAVHTLSETQRSLPEVGGSAPPRKQPTSAVAAAAA